MSTLNRSIPFVLLALFGLFGASAANAETKIGVVNFQKLLEDAPQTKTALGALDNEFAPRRRELLTMQNDLKARDEKLQREGAVMAEADRVKAEKSLRDEQREFSRKAGEYQDDASQRRNEELGKVQRYLVEEVRSYANTQGFDLVIAGDTLLFAKGQLDITANVLAVVLTKPATLPAAPAPAPAPAAQPKPAGNK